MPALELNNVSSGYNKRVVLHDISFKLQEASIYVVLGPNGAGKTTLFRAIGGILEPFSGVAFAVRAGLLEEKKCYREEVGSVHYLEALDW